MSNELNCDIQHARKLNSDAEHARRTNSLKAEEGKNPDIKVSGLQVKLKTACPENTQSTGDSITPVRFLVFPVSS